jgi:alpha-tubulin suppressor-like RCC1 family protein
MAASEQQGISLWATGDNRHGQLGTGDYYSKNSFMKIIE